MRSACFFFLGFLLFDSVFRGVLFLGTDDIFSTYLGVWCGAQATLFKMAQRVIAENAGIQDVSYALPNKHYIPVDMRYLGIDNLTPYVFFFDYMFRDGGRFFFFVFATFFPFDPLGVSRMCSLPLTC